MIPDWQLPPGVDRGLWDYLHSGEMVNGYDSQMAESPLAQADVAFCESAFTRPGRLVDLGCGTGRLAIPFAKRGFDCVGVDLSEEMLSRAKANATTAGVNVEWTKANLVDLAELPTESFDYAACLFSTLGMVRGDGNRRAVLANVARLLKPGGLLVLHIHNRWFSGLGRARVAREFLRSLIGKKDAGDITMPQAYGGAPLTLHHFTLREARKLLEKTGFQVKRTVGFTTEGKPSRSNVYGYLMEMQKS